MFGNSYCPNQLNKLSFSFDIELWWIGLEGGPPRGMEDKAMAGPTCSEFPIRGPAGLLQSLGWPTVQSLSNLPDTPKKKKEKLLSNFFNLIPFFLSKGKRKKKKRKRENEDHETETWTWVGPSSENVWRAVVLRFFYLFILSFFWLEAICRVSHYFTWAPR